MAMGTPETGNGVWVWPGVDRLPKGPHNEFKMSATVTFISLNCLQIISSFFKILFILSMLKGSVILLLRIISIIPATLWKLAPFGNASFGNCRPEKVF